MGSSGTPRARHCMSHTSVVWQKRTGGAGPTLNVVLIVDSRASLPGRCRPPGRGARAKARQENDMLRRRREPQTVASNEGNALDDFHGWLLSLPWVVERPYGLDTPGVRSFGVDCEPLGRRQLWLITGLQRHVDTDGIGLAVIVPTDTAY